MFLFVFLQVIVMVAFRGTYAERTYMVSGCINSTDPFTIDQCADSQNVIKIIYAFQSFAPSCDCQNGTHTYCGNTTKLSNTNICGTSINDQPVNTSTISPTTATTTSAYFTSVSSSIVSSATGTSATVSSTSRPSTTFTGTSATTGTTLAKIFIYSLSECNGRQSCYLKVNPVTSSCANYNETNLLIVYYQCVPSTTPSPETVSTAASLAQCVPLTVGLVVGICGALLIVIIILVIALCLKRKHVETIQVKLTGSKKGVTGCNEIDKGNLNIQPTYSEVKKVKPDQSKMITYEELDCRNSPGGAPILSNKSKQNELSKFVITESSKKKNVNQTNNTTIETREIPEIYEEVSEPSASRVNKGTIVGKQNGHRDVPEVRMADERSYYNIEDIKPVMNLSNGEMYEDAETVQFRNNAVGQNSSSGELYDEAENVVVERMDLKYDSQ